MAKGPSVATESQLATFEVAIDRLLEESDKGKCPVDIRAIDVPGLIYEVFETMLKPKYLAAGWRGVKWIFDSKGGNYIRFTP